MKLHAEVNNEKHSLEITRDGDKVFAEIDGRRYELESSEPEQDVYILKNQGKVYEVHVASGKTAAEPFSARLGSDDFEIRITDPKHLRGIIGSADHSSGRAEIKTAMPGKVVRILQSVGATLEKGDGVIVVEAMKMQNEMKSPKDGSIVEIRVAEGDTVSAGDTLVVID